MYFVYLLDRNAQIPKTMLILSYDDIEDLTLELICGSTDLSQTMSHKCIFVYFLRCNAQTPKTMTLIFPIDAT